MNELPSQVLGGDRTSWSCDRGVRGLVVYKKALELHVRGELLCARCGLSLDSDLISIEHGLTGMELLEGIRDR
jgi:hypothetical protein